VEVIPMKAALGAEVRCGDLRTLSESDAQALRQAWLDNLVVLVRGQEMSDGDLVEFGRRFGEHQRSNPLPSPLASQGKLVQGGGNPEFPEVTVVSNIVKNGVAQGGLGDGELVWHTDMSSFEVPPNQTILHALEVPASGGNTGFNNMYLAYDTLPDAVRERIDGLQLKHDATIDAAGFLRKQFKDDSGDLRTSAGAVHPLVRTHPETGRNCLFLGRRSKGYIAGMEIAESERLLDTLWQHATRGEFAWFHEWKPGDLLMWDNRCAMHRREPFDAGARRKLHRVVIKGSKPFRTPGRIEHHPRGHFDARNAA
jgi:taurine dioxygenase